MTLAARSRRPRIAKNGPGALRPTRRRTKSKLLLAFVFWTNSKSAAEYGFQLFKTPKVLRSTGFGIFQTQKVLPSTGFGICQTQKVLPSTGFDISKTPKAISAALFAVATSPKVLPSTGFDISRTQKVLPSTGFDISRTQKVLRSTGFGIFQTQKVLPSTGFDISRTRKAISAALWRIWPRQKLLPRWLLAKLAYLKRRGCNTLGRRRGRIGSRPACAVGMGLAWGRDMKISSAHLQRVALDPKTQAGVTRRIDAGQDRGHLAGVERLRDALATEQVLAAEQARGPDTPDVGQDPALFGRDPRVGGDPNDPGNLVRGFLNPTFGVGVRWGGSSARGGYVYHWGGNLDNGQGAGARFYWNERVVEVFVSNKHRDIWSAEFQVGRTQAEGDATPPDAKLEKGRWTNWQNEPTSGSVPNRFFYGNGIYVGFDGNGQPLRSTDGRNWTRVNTTERYAARGIAFGLLP